MSDQSESHRQEEIRRQEKYPWTEVPYLVREMFESVICNNGIFKNRTSFENVPEGCPMWGLAYNEYAIIADEILCSSTPSNG